MKEIVTVNGKQFELMTDYPLSEQQRQQTVSDIRNSSECSSCNKTTSLANGINSMTTDCIYIAVYDPADITVTDVAITNCSTGTCVSPVTCIEPGCTIPVTGDITVTYSNVGILPVRITPILTQTVNGGTPITMTGTLPGDIDILASGTNTVMFTGVTLPKGANQICASFTIVPYEQPPP